MPETLLTRRDHDRTIDAAVGTRIVVVLDESPTTGYNWTPVAASGALALIDSDFTPRAPGALGGGGQRTLRFEVRQGGSHALKLALMRPWEGEDSAVDLFTTTVQATPA